VDLTLDGTLKAPSSTKISQLYTPGSFFDTSNFKPIYNNILGISNILELPEFEYAEIQPKIQNITLESLKFDLDNECMRNKSNLNNLDGAEKVTFRQYRSKSPLKYVLNPASELELVSIEQAIIVRFRGEDRLFLDQPKDFQNSLALPFYKLVSQPSLKDELFTWGYPNYGYIATPTSSGFINRNKVLYNESGKELSN